MTTQKFEPGDHQDNTYIIALADEWAKKGDLLGARELYRIIEDKMYRSFDIQSLAILDEVVKKRLRIIDKQLSTGIDTRATSKSANGALNSILSFLHTVTLGKTVALMVYTVIVMALYLAIESVGTLNSQQAESQVAPMECLIDDQMVRP